MDIIERAIRTIEQIQAVFPLGRVRAIGPGLISVAELAEHAKLGDRVTIMAGALQCEGEVVRCDGENVDVLPEGETQGIAIGMMARLAPPPRFAPYAGWIGRVIDPDGRPLDGRPLSMGLESYQLRAAPPAAAERRALGPRLETGLAVFNTLLPIVRGQRLGLFAGSGVGKSTLLGQLARGVDADVIVIGLVGERGRELRDFIENVLGPKGMSRSVVIAATSDRAPQVRRGCAFAAMSVAEYFRNQGKQVLLLMDSVTRFAEAHREISISAGESADLRGFPPSTGPAIAALCERAGPGVDGQGDITAIFSVLVAGSDMDEPVADMLRGVLDGHIILDRAIAERGRFPAVDLLRSVSRSLPGAASSDENALITDARAQLGAYDRSELMIQAGLYARGSDPVIDRAIQCFSRLDKFIGLKEENGIPESFRSLQLALA